MPIAKKYRAFELVGRRVRSDVALRRGTGEGIDAGGVLNVISAHHNLVLESNVCVHCGQSIRLHGVSRNDVTLLEPGEAAQYRQKAVAVRRHEIAQLIAELRTPEVVTHESLRRKAQTAANVLETMLSRADVGDEAVSFASEAVNRVKTAFSRMREELDEMAKHSDSPEADRFVESGWLLYDTVMELISKKRNK